MSADTKKTQNEIRSEQLVEWMKVHRRTTITIVIALLVVGAGLWFTIAARNRKEALATEALDQARTSAQAGNLPLAASDLSRLITTYEGSRAAGEAELLLNQIRLLQGQAPLAVAELQKYVASGPPEQFDSPARALLGAALEQTGAFKQAGLNFEAAAGSTPYKLVAAQLLTRAGEAYTAAGDSASAEAAYKKVIDRFDDQPPADEARLRLAELRRTDSPG